MGVVWLCLPDNYTDIVPSLIVSKINDCVFYYTGSGAKDVVSLDLLHTSRYNHSTLIITIDYYNDNYYVCSHDRYRRNSKYYNYKSGK